MVVVALYLLLGQSLGEETELVGITAEVVVGSVSRTGCTKDVQLVGGHGIIAVLFGPIDYSTDLDGISHHCILCETVKSCELGVVVVYQCDLAPFIGRNLEFAVFKSAVQPCAQCVSIGGGIVLKSHEEYMEDVQQIVNLLVGIIHLR